MKTDKDKQIAANEDVAVARGMRDVIQKEYKYSRRSFLIYSTSATKSKLYGNFDLQLGVFKGGTENLRDLLNEHLTQILNYRIKKGEIESKETKQNIKSIGHCKKELDKLSHHEHITPKEFKRILKKGVVVITNYKNLPKPGRLEHGFFNAVQKAFDAYPPKYKEEMLATLKDLLLGHSVTHISYSWLEKNNSFESHAQFANIKDLVADYRRRLNSNSSTSTASATFKK